MWIDDESKEKLCKAVRERMEKFLKRRFLDS